MLQQRINSFPLPMIGADSDIHVEFDLTEKLKGSFEERASIIQASVGGPWMTRNEARADNNLPPIDGGDELIVPLNVVAGGQASPQDTHMNQNSDEVEIKKIVPSHRKDTAQTIMIKGKADEEEDAEMAEILKRFFQRQGKSVLPKIGAGSEWWDEDRWNTELADDLEPLIVAIADKHGKDASATMGMEYVIEITRKYLRKMAEGRARMINTKTREKLEEAVEDEEQDPAEVFKLREDRDSISWGSSIASAVTGWAVIEAAHQVFLKFDRSAMRTMMEVSGVTFPAQQRMRDIIRGEIPGADGSAEKSIKDSLRQIRSNIDAFNKTMGKIQSGIAKAASDGKIGEGRADAELRDYRRYYKTFADYIVRASKQMNNLDHTTNDGHREDREVLSKIANLTSEMVKDAAEWNNKQ